MNELSSLLRWDICGLRRNVRLLEGLRLLNRRRVDVCNGVVTVAPALNAEDDEEDPGSELENTADHEHGNRAIKLAHVGGDTGVVAIVGAVV